MAKNYRISIGVDGLIVRTTPQYDRLIIQGDRPDGEVFLRPTLETTLVFMRYDYDYLATVALNKEIEVYIELDNGDGTYMLKYTGVFTKTDCEWDEDARICRVKPRTRDAYEKIMQGLNKEFNLIDLGAPLTPISFKKKPIVQAYLFDSNYVSNFQQGNYWESPVIAGDVNAVTLVNKYYFTLSSNFAYIPGDDTLNPNVSGKYSLADGYREDGAYRLTNSGTTVIIRRVSDGVTVYQGVPGEAFLNPTDRLQPAGSLTSTVDGISKVQGFWISVYLRYYTDQLDIAGVPTFEIPADDIVAQNDNYTRVIGYSADNAAAHSGSSNNPTPYGRFADDADNFAGKYFTIYTPAGAPFVGAAYPLARSDWNYYSLWFQFTPFTISTEDDYSTDITVNDAYHLHDVIKAFLTEIDPLVSFSNSADYSQFLYDVSNPIRSVTAYPMIVPKSNILVGNYDQPTKKAPLRFGELLQFLKDFYKVYWYIRDGKFILEHIEYFERGGSYTTDQVGADLTTEIDPKTKLPWAYRTAKYTYDKSAMPERIEWNWMDPQSSVFEGYPIQMLDPQVEKGNVEVKSLSKFAADIDFISVSPGEVSREGFVWIEAGVLGMDYYVLEAAIQFEDLTLNIQNGYATLTYAHGEYHTYQLPCEQVAINDETTTADSVIKTKVQEIQFPSDPVPSDIELVITTLGNGKPHSRTINLLTGMITTTLRHEQ